MRSLFVYSSELAGIEYGVDHPFKPERARKTQELCHRYGVLGHSWMETLDPPLIGRDVLSQFHTEEYLDILEKADRGEVSEKTLAHGLGTEDCPLFEGMYRYAVQSSGGTYTGAQKIAGGEVDVVFNPFGGFHHAFRDHAEGFCYINDAALAILHFIQKGRRVAYLDMDAHYGNGVQEGFYSNDKVLVISLHESGKTLYPFGGFETELGEGKGLGYTVNIPLLVKSDDEVFLLAFHQIVVPLLKAYQPEVLVALIGADTQISDPLTHLRMTNNSYQEAIKVLVRLCPRILALGGGGYDLFRTARCWTLAWAALNSLQPEDEFTGLVGGMMYGPEMEMGSLYDPPILTQGEDKEAAVKDVERVILYLKKTLFPLWSLSDSTGMQDPGP